MINFVQFSSFSFSFFGHFLGVMVYGIIMEHGGGAIVKKIIQV